MDVDEIANDELGQNESKSSSLQLPVPVEHQLLVCGTAELAAIPTSCTRRAPAARVWYRSTTSHASV